MKQTIKFKALSKESIDIIGQKSGLSDTSIFTKFIQIRFPEEKSIDYISEWAFRFISGNPIKFMDRYSRQVYQTIIIQLCKEGD